MPQSMPPSPFPLPPIPLSTLSNFHMKPRSVTFPTFTHAPSLSTARLLRLNSLPRSSRMREIQTSLAERALQLLALPEGGSFLLDVGAGSGLSGECITEHGHYWTGCDISKDMLEVAVDQEVAPPPQKKTLVSCRG